MSRPAKVPTEEIKRLLDQGLGYADIARQTGISYAAISQRAHRINCPNPNPVFKKEIKVTDYIDTLAPVKDFRPPRDFDLKVGDKVSMTWCETTRRVTATIKSISTYVVAVEYRGIPSSFQRKEYQFGMVVKV